LPKSSHAKGNSYGLIYLVPSNQFPSDYVVPTQPWSCLKVAQLLH